MIVVPPQEKRSYPKLPCSIVLQFQDVKALTIHDANFIGVFIDAAFESPQSNVLDEDIFRGLAGGILPTLFHHRCGYYCDDLRVLQALPPYHERNVDCIYILNTWHGVLELQRKEGTSPWHLRDKIVIGPAVDASPHNVLQKKIMSVHIIYDTKFFEGIIKTFEKSPAPVPLDCGHCLFALDVFAFPILRKYLLTKPSIRHGNPLFEKHLVPILQHFIFIERNISRYDANFLYGGGGDADDHANRYITIEYGLRFCRWSQNSLLSSFYAQSLRTIYGMDGSVYKNAGVSVANDELQLSLPSLTAMTSHQRRNIGSPLYTKRGISSLPLGGTTSITWWPTHLTYFNIIDSFSGKGAQQFVNAAYITGHRVSIRTDEKGDLALSVTPLNVSEDTLLMIAPDVELLSENQAYSDVLSYAVLKEIFAQPAFKRLRLRPLVRRTLWNAEKRAYHTSLERYLLDMIQNLAAVRAVLSFENILAVRTQNLQNPKVLLRGGGVDDEDEWKFVYKYGDVDAPQRKKRIYGLFFIGMFMLEKVAMLPVAPPADPAAPADDPAADPAAPADDPADIHIYEEELVTRPNQFLDHPNPLMVEAWIREQSPEAGESVFRAVTDHDLRRFDFADFVQQPDLRSSDFADVHQPWGYRGNGVFEEIRKNVSKDDNPVGAAFLEALVPNTTMTHQHRGEHQREAEDTSLYGYIAYAISYSYDSVTPTSWKAWWEQAQEKATDDTIPESLPVADSPAQWSLSRISIENVWNYLFGVTTPILPEMNSLFLRRIFKNTKNFQKTLREIGEAFSIRDDAYAKTNKVKIGKDKGNGKGKDKGKGNGKGEDKGKGEGKGKGEDTGNSKGKGKGEDNSKGKGKGEDIDKGEVDEDYLRDFGNEDSKEEQKDENGTEEQKDENGDGNEDDTEKPTEKPTEENNRDNADDSKEDGTEEQKDENGDGNEDDTEKPTDENGDRVNADDSKEGGSVLSKLGKKGIENLKKLLFKKLLFSKGDGNGGRGAGGRGGGRGRWHSGMGYSYFRDEAFNRAQEQQLTSKKIYRQLRDDTRDSPVAEDVISELQPILSIAFCFHIKTTTTKAQEDVDTWWERRWKPYFGEHLGVRAQVHVLPDTFDTRISMSNKDLVTFMRRTTGYVSSLAHDMNIASGDAEVLLYKSALVDTNNQMFIFLDNTYRPATDFRLLYEVLTGLTIAQARVDVLDQRSVLGHGVSKRGYCLTRTGVEDFLRFKERRLVGALSFIQYMHNELSKEGKQASLHFRLPSAPDGGDDLVLFAKI